MTSCDRKTVYDRYEPVPADGWEKNDTLTFCVRPALHGKADDSESITYKEEVGLRINSHYPFTGLSLIVEQTAMPADVTRNDTLNCRLINNDGKMKGRGVSNYQYSFHLTNITLAKGDSLRIRIRHNMKQEMLPGISDVGIKLESI